MPTSVLAHVSRKRGNAYGARSAQDLKEKRRAFQKKELRLQRQLEKRKPTQSVLQDLDHDDDRSSSDDDSKKEIHIGHVPIGRTRGNNLEDSDTESEASIHDSNHSSDTDDADDDDENPVALAKSSSKKALQEESNVAVSGSSKQKEKGTPPTKRRKYTRVVATRLPSVPLGGKKSDFEDDMEIDEYTETPNDSIEDDDNDSDFEVQSQTASRARTGRELRTTRRRLQRGSTKSTQGIIKITEHKSKDDEEILSPPEQDTNVMDSMVHDRKDQDRTIENTEKDSLAVATNHVPLPEKIYIATKPPPRLQPKSQVGQRKHGRTPKGAVKDSLLDTNTVEVKDDNEMETISRELSDRKKSRNASSSSSSGKMGKKLGTVVEKETRNAKSNQSSRKRNAHTLREESISIVDEIGQILSNMNKICRAYLSLSPVVVGDCSIARSSKNMTSLSMEYSKLHAILFSQNLLKGDGEGIASLETAVSTFEGVGSMDTLKSSLMYMLHFDAGTISKQHLEQICNCLQFYVDCIGTFDFNICQVDQERVDVSKKSSSGILLALSDEGIIGGLFRLITVASSGDGKDLQLKEKAGMLALGCVNAIDLEPMTRHLVSLTGRTRKTSSWGSMWGAIIRTARKAFDLLSYPLIEGSMSILFKFRYALLNTANDIGGVGKAAEKSITSLVQELDEAFEVTISDNLHVIDAALPTNILKLTKRPKSKSFYQQTNVSFTQWVRTCFIQSQDGFASPKRCVKSFPCNGVYCPSPSTGGHGTRIADIPWIDVNASSVSMFATSTFRPRELIDIKVSDLKDETDGTPSKQCGIRWNSDDCAITLAMSTTALERSQIQELVRLKNRQEPAGSSTPTSLASQKSESSVHCDMLKLFVKRSEFSSFIASLERSSLPLFQEEQKEIASPSVQSKDTQLNKLPLIDSLELSTRIGLDHPEKLIAMLHNASLQVNPIQMPDSEASPTREECQVSPPRKRLHTQKESIDASHTSTDDDVTIKSPVRHKTPPGSGCAKSVEERTDTFGGSHLISTPEAKNNPSQNDIIDGASQSQARGIAEVTPYPPKTRTQEMDNEIHVRSLDTQGGESDGTTRSELAVLSSFFFIGAVEENTRSNGIVYSLPPVNSIRLEKTGRRVDKVVNNMDSILARAQDTLGSLGEMAKFLNSLPTDSVDSNFVGAIEASISVAQKSLESGVQMWRKRREAVDRTLKTKLIDAISQQKLS